jgi:dienelactone hydrolase
MLDFTPSSELTDTPFDAGDVIRGVPVDPAWRDQAGRVRVEIQSRAESLRFYGALAGGSDAEPIIYLEGDAISRGNRFNGDVVVGDRYLRLSPRLMQAEAEQFAAALQRPFVNLARPGVFGSSGDHGQRRREYEVQLIDAALDRLKDAFGWRRLNLAGQSGGGHLVAALIARRTDVGLAVIVSGNVAVAKRNLEMKRDVDATGYADFVDPLDTVAAVAQSPPGHILMLTDPGDTVVSAAVQDAYAAALRQAGVAVEQLFVPSLDPRHHDLRLPAILAAASRLT